IVSKVGEDGTAARTARITFLRSVNQRRRPSVFASDALALACARPSSAGPGPPLTRRLVVAERLLISRNLGSGTLPGPPPRPHLGCRENSRYSRPRSSPARAGSPKARRSIVVHQLPRQHDRLTKATRSAGLPNRNTYSIAAGPPDGGIWFGNSLG